MNKRIHRVYDMSALKTSGSDFFNIDHKIYVYGDEGSKPHVHIRASGYDVGFLIQTGEPFITATGELHGAKAPPTKELNKWTKHLQKWLNEPYKQDVLNRDYALAEFLRESTRSGAYREAWEKITEIWEGRKREFPKTLTPSINDSEYDTALIDVAVIDRTLCEIYAAEEFNTDDTPRLWIDDSHFKVCFTLTGDYYGYEGRSPEENTLFVFQGYLRDHLHKEVNDVDPFMNYGTLQEVAFVWFFQENRHFFDSCEYWMYELFGEDYKGSVLEYVTETVLK